MEPRSEQQQQRNERREPSRITVEQLKGRIDRGEPITILDTRAAEEWEKSDVKIPGAIRVPPKDVEHHLDKIPRGRTIITYCT